MIDVPVRVKDALRSGDYRKNYKIALMKQDYVEVKQLTATRDEEKYFEIRDSSLWSGFSANDKVRLVFPYVTGSARVDLYPAMGGIEQYDGQTVNNEVYFDFTLSAHIKSGRYLTVKSFPYVPLEIASSAQIRFYKYIESDGTIDNGNLVAESVKFDERMCSDTELKFGLCEGTSVEFQYFGLPSILGRSINIEMGIEYKNEQNDFAWYFIPMGHFDVKECSRQASTGIIKVTAYNKLMSNYLDKRMNEEIISLLDNSQSHVMPAYDLLKTLLEGFSIQKEVGEESTWIRYIIGPSYDLWGVPSVVSGHRDYDGYRITVQEVGFQIRPIDDYDPVAYYKFIMDTTKSILAETYAETVGRSIGYYVWDEDTNSSVLVYDYADGNYTYSKHFGGYFEITTTGGTYEYKLYGSNEVFDTSFINGVTGFTLHFPIDIFRSRLSDEQYELDLAHQANAYQHMNYNLTLDMMQEMESRGNNIESRITNSNVFMASVRRAESAADNIGIYESVIKNIDSDITLREIQSAVFELNCQYGKLDRITDLFSGIELNNDVLYPRDSLYPSNGLYPIGQFEAGYPAMYSKLWADEGNVRTFRYLIITYKSTEVVDGQTQEVEKKLQRTVNANGTDDYNMSDNWLFRNLVWTDAQIGAYADAMVVKMQNISWFPFEMWCAGLPYLEAGDAIEIAMKEGTYKSYVLRRNLNGIQNLQDEMINGTLDIF